MKIFLFLYSRALFTLAKRSYYGKIEQNILDGKTIGRKVKQEQIFMDGQFRLDYVYSGKYWGNVFESRSEEVEDMITVLRSSTNERSNSLLKSLIKMNEDSNPFLLIATLK